MKFKQVLDTIQETTLNRLREHMLEYDCGTISAWRKWAEDMNGRPIVSKKGNKIPNEIDYKQKQNAKLRDDLQALGYAVISVIGHWVEEGVPVREQSFFVMDTSNKGTLKKDLAELGEKYYQDSVLYIRRGGVPAISIGTFPRPFDPKASEYKSEFRLPKIEWGNGGEFMTLTRGRPVKYIP